MNRRKLQTLTCCMMMLMTIITLSCGKNNLPQIITADATIINTGSPAVDGCGWLVKISGPDSSTYSPTNLATAYQVNNLQVHITYQVLTSKFTCGDIPEPLNGGLTEIQITTIRKK